ncbi:hypothetical protein QRB36_21600 [Mycobacterium marseillense]|uniref:hypothetical protein n=1 Tax=Mycobacterium marseillense TaxID=701042 RepID=UPI0011A71854|nr:hypothetical protein [Mycobacterium marseillense]MDM3976765.1 hypothetical protein [Mycobacterium marseillense]
MSKLASWSLKKRLLWASIVVLILVCALTAVWVTRRNESPHNDCSAVEQLGRQWIAMSQAVIALENGSGERQDIIAIADKESAMSDTIRAAAGSVSDPALKNQLGKWAQGTSLLAKDQRDSATGPTQANSSSGDANYYHAAVMTHEATQALLQACPNMPHPPPAS